MPIPLVLVVNPGAFPDRPDARARQDVAWERLKKYRPAWCTLRRAAPFKDYVQLEDQMEDLHCLKRDSADEADTHLHLPFVREMMKIANYPVHAKNGEVEKAYWRGFLNNDSVVGPQFFANFQTVPDDINCIFARAWDVGEIPQGEDAPREPQPRNNINSLEGLFLRGKAVQIFQDTYPDMIFGWAWDEASVLWATENEEINIHAIDHPRSLIHQVHVSPARAGSLGPSDDIATYNGKTLNDFFNSL